MDAKSGLRPAKAFEKVAEANVINTNPLLRPKLERFHTSLGKGSRPKY